MTTNFHSHAQHGARPPRVERVAELLRQEISQLMLVDMKDPRVRMASVSAVRLSRDLRSARVLVSAVGDERERHAVVSALRHAEGYLRGQLGVRLENLKTPPKLRFELDESIAYSVHISSLLRELGPPAAEGEPLAEVAE
ncbi:MAG: 30S ribosome-binding factor RbfA [Candidatus Dormibacteria bacterium]